MTLSEKYDKLKKYLLSLEGVAVAFSGGVDSAFLLKAAHDVLGDKTIAVTAKSQVFPEREMKEAEDFCKSESIKQIVFNLNQLEIRGFKDNPPDRCYICKKELMSKIKTIAEENNLKHVAEGSNIDDLGDYRPGLQAVSEFNIKSPLRYAGLNKAEIRELSKRMGLKTCDKPSFACLASRFPYGEEITGEKLIMIDRAEQLLINLGFNQIRVRIQGETARIEACEKDFSKLFEKETREKIISEFKKYGFTYISADLQGYRTGSMNETLKGAEKSG
ncbi:MAG: ATP-dependent sacrificial sulfur transferase LarE [Clostridiales bacterium]|nr:ATP-dependent sacrificial sulfur transferase LarE [Clostridiales bacterium]